MTRRVVFNADDLGMAPEIDAAVFAVARAGVVREASLCVTGASAESAMAQAKQLPAGVGLHFCLTEGQALSGPLRGLTDRRGRFLPLEGVLASCLARVPLAGEVERELALQLGRARELGASLTHLNGHHHVHLFPVVRDAVLAVLEREGSLHVRVPPLRPSGEGLRGRLLARFARALSSAARQRGVVLRTLPLWGMSLLGRADHAAAFDTRLQALPDEAVEWVVHPRSSSGRRRRLSLATDAGPEELATLTRPDLLERLARLGIAPASYAEAHSSS